MRTYIAGPITGVAHYRDHFARAAKSLETAGHAVVSPAELPIREGWEWADYMRAALPLMLTCQRVALLPGWEASRGARIEVELADELGMPVRTVAGWLAGDG